MLPKSLFVSVLQTVVLATTSSTATSQAIAATAAAAAAAIHANTPPAPGLSFLYTSFVNIGAPINIGVGPYGDRLAIPITGGNFTGKIQGEFL